MKNFFIKMFTAHSGLSSKRVCGFLGWLVCLFICSTSLLGIDSIVGIWYKKNKND